jgi:hypothetical protein
MSKRCGGWSRVQFFMFENPGVAVRDENRVQARGQRGIDVRLRAVADHPGGSRGEFIFLDDRVIGRGVFLRDDLGRRKIIFSPERSIFPDCSTSAPLVTRIKRCRSCEDTAAFPEPRAEVDGMIGDAVGEAVDLGVQLGRDRLTLSRSNVSTSACAKAVQAVAVLHDAFALHIVEHFAHLLGRKLVMIEKRNEAAMAARSKCCSPRACRRRRSGGFEGTSF